ncbi:MAG: OB-fold nucleic acid binding domain-containing protein, partial [Dehalococcoidia bacterium]|nr:OB-fold nucleic acid binding domain-containing protein [Dehalococcoidia bacterium]
RAIATSEKLAWEKELLGVYLSDHPFAVVLTDPHLNAELCGAITDEHLNQSVLVVGMVASTRTLFTREGRAFCSVALEDLVGSIELTVWSDVYERTRDLWREGAIVRVSGRVKPRDDHLQIVVDDASLYQRSSETEARVAQAVAGMQRRLVRITFREQGNPEDDCRRFDQLVAVLQAHPGDDTAQVIITDGKARVRVELPDVRGFALTSDARERLESLLGPDAIEVRLKPPPTSDPDADRARRGRRVTATGTELRAIPGHRR